jgi:hypothetical protein
MRRFLPTIGSIAVAAALTVCTALPATAEDRLDKPGSWVPWSQLALTTDKEVVVASWVPWSELGSDTNAVWTVASKVERPSVTMGADRPDRASHPITLAAETEEIDVIALPVDPQIANAADQVLPGAMTPIEDALRSLRSVALRDPRITAVLRDKGVSVDDVIGVVHTDEALTVIVGDA